MGVLEQLRKEANQKKSTQKQELNQTQQCELNYKRLILPKMQEIFNYLQELVDHLNYLEVPVLVEEYTPRFPKMGVLAQKDYKISTDGFGGFADINKIMHINVTFNCVGEGEFHYLVSGKGAIEKEISFLHTKRLTVNVQKMPGKINKEETAKIFVKRSIPVRLRFAVDYENSAIHVVINNYSDFSLYTESWQAADMDADFLDVIARYLLRKDTEFIKPEISDEHREVLRKRLAKIRKSEGLAH